MIRLAINIQTQKTYIPVHLGELELQFDLSDDNVLRFRKEAIRVHEELEDVSASEDINKAMKQAKDALRKGFDVFFGEGTFEKVYELSPSLTILIQYFVQISEAISEKLEEIGYNATAEDKARKYLAKKKK